LELIGSTLIPVLGQELEPGMPAEVDCERLDTTNKQTDDRVSFMARPVASL